MGSKSRIIRHGFFLLMLLLVPPAMATESPPCIAYGYTIAEGEPHYSMIVANSYVFGNSVVVISNCDNTTLLIDGMVVSSSPTTKINTYVSAGTHDVTIRNDGFIQNYSNVTFIQSGQLSNVINQLPNEYNPHAIPYTIEEIDSIELWSGVGAILVSWLIVTGFLWKIIKAHSDKNHCVEVS